MKLSGMNNLIKFQEKKIYSIFEGWINYAELYFIMPAKALGYVFVSRLLRSFFFHRNVFVSLFCGGLFIIVTDDEISDRHGSHLHATRWKVKVKLCRSG